MKKLAWLTILALLAVILGSMAAVQAEIIPPHGEGQIGLQAVVLCETLTLRRAPDTGSAAVSTLRYGTRIIVMRQEDGWAECVLSDSVDAGPAGWVSTEYLAVDPAWYRTEGPTPVYAWDDEGAPKVALLSADTLLPILRDDGEWIIVSLRGSTGWIRKTAADLLPAKESE